MEPPKDLGNEDEDFAIVPPDGGWGWVVVLSAFYCQIVIDGVQFTFGMMLIEISQFYKVEEYQISFIVSLMFGFHFLAGPICAGLSRTFGDRTIAVLGCLLSTIGLSSAYFQPPYPLLYFTFGVIGGTGLCFVNMNSIVITSIYFTRKRMLALGIVVCGTGVGTILCSTIANYAIKRLRWEYVCLIEAGMTLSMIFAVACFRPLEPAEIRSSLSLFDSDIKTVVTLEDDDRPSHQKFYYFRSKSLLTSSPSSLSINTMYHHTEQLLDEYATIIANPEVEYSSTFHKMCSSLLKCVCPFCPEHHRRRVILLMNPKTKGRVLREGSFMGETDMNQSRKFWRQCYDTIGVVLDCSILKSLSFFFFCISGAFSASAMIIVFTYEKVRLISEGASPDEAMFYFMSLGASNVFWRLTLGLLPKFRMMNYNIINIFGLFIGGLATVISGLSSDSAVIHICGFLSCLSIGCFAVYCPVILLDLVGITKVSNATGISMMFMGVISILGPPISGVVMRITENYGVPFLIAGAMFMTSSALFATIYCTTPHQHRMHQ